jgi:hypothetical protein
MRKIAIAVALVIGANALPATLAIATAGASPPGDLQAAKAASARYHSVEQALAAGYVEGSPCEQLPGVGGMGHHYVNPALLGDLDLDPVRPEILLYAPKSNGRLELVGVEYFAVALANTESGPAPWFEEDPPPLGFFNPAPVLFGQTFDGPMEGHGPKGAMPWHYDLHVWLWQSNPAGMFAMWNPNVACPAP